MPATKKTTGRRSRAGHRLHSRWKPACAVKLALLPQVWPSPTQIGSPSRRRRIADCNAGGRRQRRRLNHGKVRYLRAEEGRHGGEDEDGVGLAGGLEVAAEDGEVGEVVALRGGGARVRGDGGRRWAVERG
ncbi:hypothetical protein ZWY2020_034760 [Hordeum vulgare]|nr:hypothetical protein ZWY2020_034760 [Hordeum vulgare]